MVAAPVFHREVPVGRHRKHEARQPLLDARLLVPQLVAGIDTQTGVGSRNIREQQHRPPR